MTKDHSTNAEKLTTELIIVDKEMRENFREHPQLDDAEKDIIRRDTYLATIRRWMKKHDERDQGS